MTTTAGGGEGHTPDPLVLRTGLPLARVSELVAIQYEKTLIISVTGQASGFDGTLEIVHSNTRIYPPKFSVFEHPGNTGITGNGAPTRTVTATRAFSGTFPKIQVATEQGTQLPLVRHAQQAPEESIHALEGHSEKDKQPEPDFGWHAWINMMPGSARSLHVRGLLLMPTPGYKLELKRREPQGFNPAVLLLDLVVTKPSGITTQVLTPTRAAYDESPATFLYTTVHIVNTEVVIPVEYAS